MCGYPTVFPLAMKYLRRLVQDGGLPEPLPAYYDFHYRHDAAPMLDYLACVIDHKVAHARGGTGEEHNLVTACNKCNVRKGDQEYMRYVLENPLRKVKAKFGPPERWDGLASVFVALAPKYAGDLTQNEKTWLKELKAYFASRTTAL
jgi:hypothetical protein